MAESSSSNDFYNRNPTGKNQHTDCRACWIVSNRCILLTAKPIASKGDSHVKEILTEYHRRGITDRVMISELLLVEHGIKMRYCCLPSASFTFLSLIHSEATIARRRKAFGLMGSGITTRDLPDQVKQQLVLDQIAKDPANRQGPRTIKEGITLQTGIQLTRYVSRHVH
jgi:hypothetical protein